MEGIINIAGVMPRIGTTTQALQLARYIQSYSDYKAAYVECNLQDYIWSASQMYREVKSDRTGGHLNIEGIEMYTGAKFSELTAGGADIDFLICDYGDMSLSGFDKDGFLNGTVRILVAGIKANEIHYTEAALRKAQCRDAIYIFSHTLPSDREELSGLMGSRGADTFFSPYIPDPFYQITDDAAVYFEKVMTRIVSKIRER